MGQQFKPPLHLKLLLLFIKVNAMCSLSIVWNKRNFVFSFLNLQFCCDVMNTFHFFGDFRHLSRAYFLYYWAIVDVRAWGSKLACAWLTRELCHVSKKLIIKVNVNSLHFNPTKTCIEKKPCVNRKHNSTWVFPYTEFIIHLVSLKQQKL